MNYLAILELIAIYIEVGLLISAITYIYVYYFINNIIKQFTDGARVSILQIDVILKEFLAHFLRKLLKRHTFNAYTHQPNLAYEEFLDFFELSHLKHKETLDQLIMIDRRIASLQQSAVPEELSKWLYPPAQILAYKTWIVSAQNHVKALQMSETLRILKQKQKDQQTEQEKFQQKAQPPQTTNWRTILGVSSLEKDFNVIKRAYRQLAFEYHPDRGGDAEKFKEISVAYSQAKKEFK